MDSFEESFDKVKKGFVSSLNKVRGKEEPEPVPEDEQSFFSESVSGVRKALDLSWKQRAIGFGICVGIAAAVAVLGCALVQSSTAAFGVLFTVGTIAGLVSTLFLVGPINQFKKFIDTNNIPDTIMKIVSAVVLIIAIVLTLLSALLWRSAPLSVLLCITEFVALIWYSILLIPFASIADRISLSKGVRYVFLISFVVGIATFGLGYSLVLSKACVTTCW